MTDEQLCCAILEYCAIKLQELHVFRELLRNSLYVICRDCSMKTLRNSIARNYIAQYNCSSVIGIKDEKVKSYKFHGNADPDVESLMAVICVHMPHV